MGVLQSQLFLQLLSSQQQSQKSPHFLWYLKQTKHKQQFVPPKDGYELVAFACVILASII